MVKYRKGKITRATVTGIEAYGAFVSLDEYYSGLIHISEVSHGFVKDIHDYVNIGDIIYAEVLEIDEETSQLKLSIKNIDYKRKPKLPKKKIIETEQGFKTLAYKLPYWIEENLKNNKKITNSIDK